MIDITRDPKQQYRDQTNLIKIPTKKRGRYEQCTLTSMLFVCPRDY